MSSIQDNQLGHVFIPRIIKKQRRKRDRERETYSNLDKHSTFLLTHSLFISLKPPPFSYTPFDETDLSPFTKNSKNDPEAGELHPDARRKPTPDFEGETNPTTGEVGGPKKDPLSWQREWTYGGRATDF